MTAVFLTPQEPEAQSVWEPTPLHTQTLLVEIPTFGAPDVDGVPARSSAWITVRQCNVQQAAAVEAREGGAMVAVERLRVSAPLTEAITESCTVTWRDGTYTVEGAPAHFRGTWGLDHTEFVMTRVRG